MARRSMLALLAVAVAAVSAAGQGRGMAGRGRGMATSPQVELKGKIERVQITPGEGMPYLLVKTADRSAKVYLGSMRYLMAAGFNPKVDEEVAVKAFRMGEEYMAASVTLSASGKTIRLRGDDGIPLWRGGPPR